MSFKAVRFLAPAVARRFERKSPKRGLRHGAGSRPVGFLDRSVAWRKCTVGQRAAGGTVNVATCAGRPLDKCVSEVRLRSNARRRRPFCRPWVSGHADACTHIGARSYVTDLQQSCSQVARAVDTTDFRPSRNGGGGVPATAQSLRECRRAIARQRRQFADRGGSTRDVATRTGAQLSSDSGQHVQARRALRSRFSDSRISRPLLSTCSVAWRKCTVGQRVARGRRGGVAMQTSAFAVFDGR